MSRCQRAGLLTGLLISSRTGSPASWAYGGGNWKVDTVTEADAVINDLRGSSDAAAAVADTLNKLTTDDRAYVTARMDGTAPSSRTYGGANWKVDNGVELDAFGAAADVAEDGGTGLYTRLAPVDQEYAYAQMGPFDANVMSDTEAPAWTDYPIANAAQATVRVKVEDPPMTVNGESIPAEPVADMPVRAQASGSSQSTVVRTNQDGYASLALPAGTYRVSLAQRPTIGADVTVSPNAVQQVTLSTVVGPAATPLGDQVHDGFKAIGRGAKCQRDAGVSNARACNKLRGLRNRSEDIAKALFPKTDVVDNHKRNAMQHSLFNAWATRLMQQEYDGQLDVDFAHKQAQSTENLDSDEELRFRRASFMDRNNNRVGYHFQRQYRTRNAVQLCAGLRSKSISAKFMTFPEGSDRISGWPEPNEQTRLGYMLASGNPLSAAALGQTSPCGWAFKKYDN